MTRVNVRRRETNLGRLAADSSLAFARDQYPEKNVDVALKHGGGIRTVLVGSPNTKLNVASVLAFDNRIAVVQLTGAELIATMENSISRVPAVDGRFPQIAGMIMEYDASKPGIPAQFSVNTPSRIRRLVIERADGTEDVLVEEFVAQGDLTRCFTMVTNDFLIAGRDGYQALKVASETRSAERPDIGERQILADYISQELNRTVDLPDPPKPTRVKDVSD